MCVLFFDFVRQIEAVTLAFISMYRRLIGGFARQCRQSPCSWWCLCCQKWLCWIAFVVVAIVVALVLTIFYVLYVLTSIVTWLVCELLCIAIVFAVVIPLNVLAVIMWVFSLGSRELALIEPPRCFAVNRRRPSEPSSGSGPQGLTSAPGESGGGPQPTTSTGLGRLGSRTKRFAALGSKGEDFKAPTAPVGTGAEGWSSASCGCREGKVGALFGLLVFLIVIGPFGTLGSGALETEFLVVLGFVLVGGLIGKLVGQLVSAGQLTAVDNRMGVRRTGD